ncbi:hypothetical protein GOP96_07055 [Vibrio cholerae]|nr:hypothetical protein [Vibrio cholerae]
MVQESILLSLNIVYELTRKKNVGEKIDFDTLPYTYENSGIEASRDYNELDDELILFCQLGTEGGTKALRFHYGVHCPSMGVNRWLSFDVRELFNDGNFSYPEFPNKEADRLKIVTAMISKKFGNCSELLEAIVSTKSQPISI